MDLDEIFIGDNHKTDKSNDITFDIVYSFVDTSDKTWRVKYNKYIKRYDESRYDQNHLLFSIQTIAKYFPQNLIKNIFIVSDYHRIENNDKKLDNVFKKIIYIDHEDIIPKNNLPTFNSYVIEAFLWNIPKLSNHFLYFNDDFILGNYVDLSDFFYDKHPAQFYHKLGSSKHPWFSNIRSSNQLFETKFKYYPNLCPQHAPYHIIRPVYEKTFSIFNKDLSHMIQNHKSRRYDKNSHCLLFLYAMYVQYQNIMINKKTSFSHIFDFNKNLVESTKKRQNRKKFYAISSKITNNNRTNFDQFRYNLLYT